tara:strand:+ start:1209 stop:2507 length:1299 start_codon:yes stop_codon:yes gene_type:complete
VNKICIIALLLIFTSCSLDTKSGIWTKEKKIKETKKDIIRVLEKEKILINEINSNLRIKIKLTKNSKIDLNFLTNNLGVLDFNKNVKKSSKFKFSKIKNFSYFEPEIAHDGKNFIFFDDKANLLKFDDEFKSIWKKNFYSKQEIKSKPILTFAIENNFLVIADSIGKIYLVDTVSGKLIWSKINPNPFNSQIKIYKNKIYSIDINNVLRCFSLKDGKELWKFKSENTFLKSNKRNSLVVDNDTIFFNNSLGDITAINANDGKLVWQTPTQSSDIYENAFGLVMSDLVIDKGDIIFSNNRNEFYSINRNNGLLNWKQNINSSTRPVSYENLLFTFSNEGYFFILDKKTGKIVRSTDVFNSFKPKKRNKIKPIGFILGKEKIILSTNNGRLLIININDGRVDKILKIDNEKVSRPFVFNKSIILVKNNSVIRLN